MNHEEYGFHSVAIIDLDWTISFNWKIWCPLSFGALLLKSLWAQCERGCCLTCPDIQPTWIRQEREDFDTLLFKGWKWLYPLFVLLSTNPMKRPEATMNWSSNKIHMDPKTHIAYYREWVDALLVLVFSWDSVTVIKYITSVAMSFEK